MVEEEEGGTRRAFGPCRRAEIQSPRVGSLSAKIPIKTVVVTCRQAA